MDTRERIMAEALDLFAERGYEKTSLREIAERLDVSKAAVYYHFKTKDDIFTGILDSLMSRVDAIIAWGQEQPPGAGTRAAIVQRYTAEIRSSVKLIRFLQENQASLAHLDAGQRFKAKMKGLGQLLAPAESGLPDRMRAVAAIMVMHVGWMFREEHAKSDQEIEDAILLVAGELTSSDPLGT
ncbi:TetR/AcrR family transcriptional regulator [Longispora albida]|uniref:TetR/AcrR family transcriptional regulator n=1 Tax=Longispora albida TaxID=203523 RepID=UPI00036952A1|nr:TetR/AcrR family transcriptional regulator [Longispora albida]